MPRNMQKYYIDIYSIVTNKDILNKMENYKKYAVIELNKIGIDGGIFYDFFVNSYTYDIPENKRGQELFTLDQILENYQSQNWVALLPEKKRNEFQEKYPNARERYLQITSIEGGGSYFYDKETDYVYDVNWGEEEAMIKGEKTPWFTSFYDFLKWYYGESDEE